MKKGKLFLTAFAAIAIVGSALAFSAANRGNVRLYFPSPSDPTICNVPSTPLYKLGAQALTATTVPNTPCITLFSTSKEN